MRNESNGCSREFSGLFQRMITVLVFFTLTFKIDAQYFINFDTGFSTLDTHFSSNPDLKKEWKRQTFIHAYRIALRKHWRCEQLILETGALVSFQGGEHIFLDKWRFIYGGLSVGGKYNFGKVGVGLRSSAAIELWSNWLIDFKLSRTFNVDIEPNLSWDIGDRFQIVSSISYGVNPSVRFSKGIYYRQIAYLVGFNYKIGKASVISKKKK